MTRSTKPASLASSAISRPWSTSLRISSILMSRSRCDRGQHLVVEVVDQRGHVLANRLAEAVAGVGLGGAFEVADVQHVGFDADLREQVFVERELGAHAGEQHFARLGEDDLIAGRGELVLRAHRRFEQGVDLLPLALDALDRARGVR